LLHLVGSSVLLYLSNRVSVARRDKRFISSLFCLVCLLKLQNILFDGYEGNFQSEQSGR